MLFATLMVLEGCYKVTVTHLQKEFLFYTLIKKVRTLDEVYRWAIMARANRSWAMSGPVNAGATGCRLGVVLQRPAVHPG